VGRQRRAFNGGRNIGGKKEAKVIGGGFQAGNA